MRLAAFLRSHMQEIVREWVDFATTLRPFDRSTDIETLRNAIFPMLRAMAEHMERPESPREQFERSRGCTDATAENPSPGWEHGLERLDSGLTINQVVAEFRALRAVVTRLYSQDQQAHEYRLRDLVRFDEAVDQAVAEALAAYTTQLDKLRNTLLAVLAHDLRSPLQSIAMTAEVMALLEPNPRLTPLVDRIKHGTGRMTDLIDDFLTFVTPTLGGQIPIHREVLDMTKLCEGIVAEVNASLRTVHIQLESAGDTIGQWDRARIEQVMSNLLRNAIDHGAQDRPITVTVNGKSADVHVCVHNFGEPIPAQAINAIFKPLVQLGQQDARKRDHFGLGLFIAKELVERHGGEITATSSVQAGTIFRFMLPRSAQPAELSVPQSFAESRGCAS